ncbi:hypothetical protein NC651_035094 [Populus alba x Populus x berolinensis]|nr:hypothetical protein NC651_035094 [Populus alba x Populus x berolinensis]
MGKRVVNNIFPAEKMEDQKAVDAPVMKAIEGVADLKSFLGARFSLNSGTKLMSLSSRENDVLISYYSFFSSRF